jgi:hypothetical protein
MFYVVLLFWQIVHLDNGNNIGFICEARLEKVVEGHINEHSPCHFPFKSEGKIYDSCTSDNGTSTGSNAICKFLFFNNHSVFKISSL